MRKQPVFKETQLFDWDVEPAEERPSTFFHSTGYSTLSGIREKPKSRGPNVLVLVGAVIMGLGIVGLLAMTRFLRG